jgi:hypothetical protein
MTIPLDVLVASTFVVELPIATRDAARGTS